jgi:hypothetical protein
VLSTVKRAPRSACSLSLGITLRFSRRRELTDGQAKRHVATSFARLCQALERKGHGYIGLTAYEKPMDGLLQGHALLHVRQDCLHVVKRWTDRFDERPPRLREQVESVALHARYAVNSELAYIPKQRQFNGPFERPGQPWQRSMPFAGTRVSFTKMARAIIEKAERQCPERGVCGGGTVGSLEEIDALADGLNGPVRRYSG